MVLYFSTQNILIASSIQVYLHKVSPPCISPYDFAFFGTIKLFVNSESVAIKIPTLANKIICYNFNIQVEKPRLCAMPISENVIRTNVHAVTLKCTYDQSIETANVNT